MKNFKSVTVLCGRLQTYLQGLAILLPIDIYKLFTKTLRFLTVVQDHTCLTSSHLLGNKDLKLCDDERKILQDVISDFIIDASLDRSPVNAKDHKCKYSHLVDV